MAQFGQPQGVNFGQNSPKRSHKHQRRNPTPAGVDIPDSIDDPTDIQDLTAWWDASDETSITTGTGTNVTAWADQAGTYEFTEADGATSPDSGADINELNVITFVAAGLQKMTSDATVAQLCGTAGSFTIIALAKPDAFAAREANDYENPAVVVDDDGWFSIQFFSDAGSNWASGYTFNVAQEQQMARQTSSDYLKCLVLRQETGAGGSFRLNGNPVAGLGYNLGPYDTTNNLVIGKSGFVANYTDMKLAELMFFDRALTLQEINLLESYLDGKWSWSNPPVWTPADLTDLAGWWDVSDSDNVTTSGSNVTQVDDLSGNDYHMINGIGTWPTYPAGTINDLDTMNFNTAAYLDTNAQWDTINTQDFTIATVVKCTSALFAKSGWETNPNRASQIISSFNTWGLGLAFTGIGTSTWPVIVYWQDPAAGAVGVYDVKTHTPSFSLINEEILLVVHRSGTTAKLYLNGALAETWTLTDDDIQNRSDGLRLGQTPYGIGGSNAGLMYGKHGEIILCDAALGQADLDDMQGYLMSKWNILQGGSGPPPPLPP